MYSPKIREDLIPILFKLARRKKRPMTKLVDQILRNQLKERGWLDELQSEGDVKHHFREI